MSDFADTIYWRGLMRTTNCLFFTIYRLLLVFIFIFVLIKPCDAKKGVYIPELLQPWVGWVLYDKEEQMACIPEYNNAAIYHCNWPSEIKISLNDSGGEFKQSWFTHVETWVALPGSIHQWPRDIQVDGREQIIIQKENTPGVSLSPGDHTITGRFTWLSLPENLQIPDSTAMVSLIVNNEAVVFPEIDGSGRLWLKKLPVEERIENRLKIESFRLIEDSIPSQVLLYFTLDVAGSARETRLGPLYAPNRFTPLSLTSLLPARIEPDGQMLIQLRPGQYSVSLTLRHTGPLHEILFPPSGNGIWPRQEIWSFRANPDLRLVEVDGVPSIDPLQTAMPNDWHKYPAYRLQKGNALRFNEIKRGDPQPAPDQLTLNRNLWLRFDGSGYTIQDTINGKKNTHWRLEMDPVINLGRVAVDGIEQFITRQKGADRAGIELRNGMLTLTADSIYQGKISTLPATGWDHDFQQVQGRLNLPPGWKLINATGIDNIPNTWIKRWTLLDFFIVLIFTIALAKLFSKPLAGIALLTMVLIYHEPLAPRYVWLALLIGFSLLKYLPDGKFKTAVKVFQAVTVFVLVIIVIPYAIHALRIGIYPQLARPWSPITQNARQWQDSSQNSVQRDVIQEMQPEQKISRLAKIPGKAMDKSKGPVLMSQGSSQKISYPAVRVMQYDPDALTQTGPGIPDWLPFETIHFSWSGPVPRDQKVSFFLIGPRTNLVLSVVRVLLIILLALGMFGVQYRPENGFQFRGMKSLKIFSFLIILLFIPALSHSTEMPSPQILDELQKRLLESDECYPACANISQGNIRIDPTHLSMDAHIDALIDVAIPVPGDAAHWLPRKVMINNAYAKGLLRRENQLWIWVPAGRHIVTLSGPVPRQNTLQFPFPLKPHQININAQGWSVEGIHPDGTFDAQLQFKRTVEQDSNQTPVFETGLLPPFALVERTIQIGLIWKIQTQIQRLSPTGSGILLDIPLLPGESVTTEGIRVTQGAAKINLGADQTHLFWESFLEPSDHILLEHQQTTAWTEIWKVDVSPIFHLEYDGIPVILHKTGTHWSPTWHPWPGESVKLIISRPSGVKGQTLTIESSHLELHPGQKTTAARISLSIKSSQGGQHIILLPADARLQEVKIKGKIQPIRQEGRNVALPITPGQQQVELEWIEAKGITTRFQSSDMDLGAQSVNTSVDIHLPRNRWPLFLGGEQLVGPAVLFWSQIIIIVLIAFGLSKTGWTPLRFYHWFLLGIGMSMSNLAAAVMVVAWLIALNFREKAIPLKGRAFNVMQIGMVALTIAGVGSLIFAISMGLLGHPDMNILGNGSTHALLRWYQDVSDHTLPRAWVFSIPMLTYRIAMLAWALWVSFWLIDVLKWGWQQFTSPTIWYHLPPKIKKSKKTDLGQPRTDVDH